MDKSNFSELAICTKLVAHAHNSDTKNAPKRTDHAPYARPNLPTTVIKARFSTDHGMQLPFTSIPIEVIA